MSKLNINNLTNENEDGAPRISGISTFSSAHYFVPPSGSTAQRPSSPGEGMIRFNTDSGHLEYYTGEFWDDVIVNNYQIGISTNPAGTSGGLGHRGLWGGGFTDPANTDTIDYITISTLGNAQDFGNLTRSDRHAYSGVSSKTRGCWGGGFPQATQTTIDYITIASTGDALDFGDMSAGRVGSTGLSNDTRGIWGGGYSYAPGPATARDVIDYITIASTGNAQDFGDLLAAYEYSSQSSCASSTRGIQFRSGNNVIQYITISTTGNALDFGDSSATGNGAGLSNSTRGIIAGGGTPGNANTIEFITIASTGDAIDFGDMSNGSNGGSGTSSPTRGVYAGMRDPTVYNNIDYITIDTTGNAIDFGDLTVARTFMGACSNGHGGL